ncbi:MAG: 6-pyruvoyl-tetrahydropterin synthase-related protein [Candidatus Aenigmatarchaeota archaeon]
MKKENIVEILIILFIYIFLFSYFNPSLIFSNTTLSGGDTVSHNYLVYYLKNYLLPNGKIIGWSPDWYAGFPIFRYYFFLPYLIAVFISYFTSLQISLRIISILGIFLLPLTTFIGMKILKFKFPIPSVSSLFSLIFLFSESFTIYGANIPSTLAGEISYSISFSILILLVAFLYKGINENKYLIKNSFLLALTSLNHLYTTSLLFFSSAFFLFKKYEFLKRLKYLFLFYFIGFSLISFWLIPFVFYSNFMTSLGWIQDRRIELLFLKPFIFFYFFALIGFIHAKRKNDERIFFFGFIVLISLAFFFLLPNGHLFNCRYLPFFYFFILLIAAYGFSEFLTKILKRKTYIFLLFFSFLIFYFIKNSITYIDFWIKWNYEGIEAKQYSKTFFNLMDYLRSLPYGRIYHEYSSEHDKFGSPRILELIPYFTGKPTMEGLLIESAISAPFHFWMQAELSSKPSCPISYVGCTSLTSNGIKHLELFNIKYIIAYSKELKEILENRENIRFLKEIDEFKVYELVGNNNYVVVPNFKPVRFSSKNWMEYSLKWFKNIDYLDIPLVFSDERNENFVDGYNIEVLPKIPLETNCKINEKIKNEEIRFETNCLGIPHLIKVSYSPNWKVEGASKIYLASPSFMLVIPEKNEVRIYFGLSFFDYIGIFFTIISPFLIFLVWRKKI